MSERCWNCERELPASESLGVFVVILEAREADGANVVRRTCGATCARKATVWDVAGRAKDKAHSANYAEVWD